MRGSHIGEHRREPVHHSHGVQRQGGSVHGGPLENHGHGFLAGNGIRFVDAIRETIVWTLFLQRSRNSVRRCEAKSPLLRQGGDFAAHSDFLLWYKYSSQVRISDIET